MAGTTYQEVIDAVGRYYGAGSDQWVQIANYGVAARDAEKILSQVPDVEIIKNNAGQITGYAYNAPATLNTGGIAADINSNVGLGTQANGNTFTTSIPASGSVSQGGNVDLTSGAKNISSGNTVSTVLGKVTTGIAALSMGCKLGAFIDRQIYNLDPDYFDNNFPSINPDTWNTIAGTNKAGKSFINALFGTDSQGNTTMYLPEDAASYLAYALAQEGFFDTGGENVISYDGAMGNLDHPNTYPPLPYTTAHSLVIGSTSYPNDATEINVSGAEYMVLFKWGGRTGNYPTFISRNQITAQYKKRYQSYWYTLFPSSTNINGVTYYYTPAPSTNDYLDNISGITPLEINNSPSYVSTSSDIIKLIYGGTSESTGGKEGVTKQDGASYPDTSGWTSPAATGAALAQQFSDDYQNKAIYTDVPQPDGTTTRIKYIPVPTTPTTGSNQTSPTNTTVTYNQTTVNQGSSTDDVVNTILRYITKTQTETATQTPNPPDTPNPTDTGTGNTPPVVAPTGQASALFAIYNPSQAQLNSFGAWLWSSNFIDQVLKLFNNPMQAIIGLHKIFASPSISGSGNIRVGYLDSGVGSNIVGAQYTTVNCGSVKVAEQFGNVFDYTDTQIRLYLPFIGIVDLDTADVMRGTVSVVYHVDVITGACLAEVKVSRDASGGTLYQYAGDASVRYPISSGSYMGVVSGVLSAVGGVASAVMTGGATLPLAAGAVAGGLSGAHTQIQHSGNFAGNAGAMGGKKPYIIIERPQSMIADGFENYQGKGANTRRTVGQMSGYFKFSDVHTDSISGAAQSEIEAIRATLESGVIA